MEILIRAPIMDLVPMDHGAAHQSAEDQRRAAEEVRAATEQLREAAEAQRQAAREQREILRQMREVAGRWPITEEGDGE